MKIYDCFTFFNELDLLEIRLEELWNVVDYFVLSESTLSHSGKPKELIFDNNKDRFKKYESKIRYINVDDMPETTDSWVRERHQRTACERALYDLQPEDLVIVSDVDEIPRAEALEMVKDDTNNYERYIFTIPMFQYKLNYMKYFDISKQPNIMVTRGHVFTNPQQEREYTWPWTPRPADIVFVDHAGWHFTYFGDDTNIVTKLKNFAHTESDVPRFTSGELKIEWMIENKYGLWGPDHHERYDIVVVDDYFPKYITENIDKWNGKIHPGAVFRVTDLYREIE
jgi:hypothetical protein